MDPKRCWFNDHFINPVAEEWKAVRFVCTSSFVSISVGVELIVLASKTPSKTWEIPGRRDPPPVIKIFEYAVWSIELSERLIAINLASSRLRSRVNWQISKIGTLFIFPFVSVIGILFFWELIVIFVLACLILIFSASSKEELKVFTTRPDTLYGVTYIALAPEHKVLEKYKDRINNYSKVIKYIKEHAG